MVGISIDCSLICIPRVRSENPIPSTHTPRTVVRKERIGLGKPEIGTRMVMTPRSIRVPDRDIRSSVSGFDYDHKFTPHMVWVSFEICLHISNGSRGYFFVNLGELAGDGYTGNTQRFQLIEQFNKAVRRLIEHN